MALAHYSPSQVRLFLDEPALWFLRYYGGVFGDVGPKAWRGTAVGKAVEMYLAHPAKGILEAIGLGQHSFLQQAEGEISDAVDTEYHKILPIFEQLQEPMGKFGGYLGAEIRAETMVDNVELPVLGYVDFAFDKGDVEIKTTDRCPSKPRLNHVRQVAFYNKARNRPQTIVYATPKRYAVYEISQHDLDSAWRQTHAALKAMDRINRQIEIVTNWREQAEMYPPRDLDNWLWDSETREAAKEVWDL